MWTAYPPTRASENAHNPRIIMSSIISNPAGPRHEEPRAVHADSHAMVPALNGDRMAVQTNGVAAGRIAAKEHVALRAVLFQLADGEHLSGKRSVLQQRRAQPECQHRESGHLGLLNHA